MVSSLVRVGMDASSFNLQSSHGIMDEDKHLSESPSSSSSSSDISADSVASSLSDLTDDATSSSSSSLDQHAIGPLYEMSTLMEQLPFKRGLSKHFQGKSQSFTSLSNVRCLEDLAKPESPYKKKLKSCKSYGGGLDSHRSYTPKASSKTISKKSSRICCSSLVSRRNSLLGNKPPIPSSRSSSSFSNQPPLFA